MNIATFDRELELLESDYASVIGIDEAGRGPLAGPVVAAACTLKPETALSLFQNSSPTEKLWDFVRDSKTVSEKKRGEVYEFVLAHYDVGIGIVSPEQIDRMNILEATFFAMKMALSDLKSRNNDKEGKQMILVDGNMIIPHYTGKQKAVTKGDSKVKCIAAASIIAKVQRDRKMLEYDAIFPQYGFASHKGYGTKAHMEALKEFGATPIHRKSFAPVKKVL